MIKNPPPTFTSQGLLAEGTHPMTLAELRESALVSGTTKPLPDWDEPWRRALVDALEEMVHQLWHVGIERTFIDGSFAEAKLHPNDIDGYFEVERDRFLSGSLEEDPAELAPNIWTWEAESRLPYRDYDKPQLPMWHRHRVELWPHYGQSSGITGADGEWLTFAEAFTRSRNGDAPRGIIELRRNKP